MDTVRAGGCKMH